MTFNEWCVKCSHVVFCHPPPKEFVEFARSNKVTVILLCQWLELDPEDVAILSEVDFVLCPSVVVYKHLRDVLQVPHKRLIKCPWDIAEPTTRSDHEVDPNRVLLAWYLDGSQPLVQDFSFLSVVNSIMDVPSVYLSVLYTDRLADDAVADLKKLQEAREPRVELLRNLSWERQMMTLASSDLTLWPSLLENVGLAGLMSVTAGTPCLAYDHPAISDVIKDGVNGVLVPCDLIFNDIGVPAVVKDNAVFRDKAIMLVNNPALLKDLRKSVHYKLDRRRKSFTRVIEDLF
jgi:glycosyltransferase involved in cell wall biosynthesis